MFTDTLDKLGIKVRLVDSDKPEEVRNAITDKTRLVFMELIGNPGLNVLDVAAVASVPLSR